MRERFFLDGNNAVPLAPCKDCERRVVGCHASCADYAAYKQDMQRNKADMCEGTKSDKVLFDYICMQELKNKRKRRRKNK